jgi:3-oxoacyl-[acyl-carrier-protein] synthase-3
MKRPLRYVITGVSSLVGRQMSIDEWAERVPVPNRKAPGTFLSGSEIRRIVGVEGKSWDPDLFRDFGAIVGVAREALGAARTTPEQIDAVLLVSATPYHVQLDFDAFRLLRDLKIPDHVAPQQLNAGCCGMARAMAVAAQLGLDNILIVTHEVSSLYMESEVYRYNTEHPMGRSLWMSAALFSDGAGAVVLRRESRASGFVIYSRDSQSFGDEPGFEDPLIHYPGGGAAHPPGTSTSAALSAYGMAGEATKKYYQKGMTLNHEALRAHRPGYAREVKRIYMHQASPRLVETVQDYLVRECEVPPDKLVSHARRYGNLVTPSTVKLLHDDIVAGAVRSGDEVCVSVVGAGPERGAYLISMA